MSWVRIDTPACLRTTNSLVTAGVLRHEKMKGRACLAPRFSHQKQLRFPTTRQMGDNKCRKAD